jgi:hypothetical protein
MLPMKMEFFSKNCKISFPYRAFAHDVTAAMLVFQFKRVLIRLFCMEHELLAGEWVVGAPIAMNLKHRVIGPKWKWVGT